MAFSSTVLHRPVDLLTTLAKWINDCASIYVSCQLRTDAEKRSLVESGLAWYSEDNKALQKADSGTYDTGSLKTESSSKYRKSRPAEGAAQEKPTKRELKKPQSLGQPGGFKKGHSPPVGVTSPMTHTAQSVLKVAGEKESSCGNSVCLAITCIYTYTWSKRWDTQIKPLFTSV